MVMQTKLAKAIYVACVTLFLTSLGFWAVLAHEDSLAASRSQTAGTAASDEQFVKEAAQGGMAEVKLGQLAEANGNNESVKKFGAKMVEDHSKASNELKEAAKKENLSLPADIDAKDKATYDKLSKLKGAEFDREYAQNMVKDHQKDVRAFQREADNGKDEVIRGFASQSLPMLQEHLKEARAMLKSVSSMAGNRHNGTHKNQRSTGTR
jgi:putative membrane protein